MRVCLSRVGACLIPGFRVRPTRRECHPPAIWELVDSGRSGAIVSRRGDVFRKQSPDAAHEVRALTWLAGHGLPVPEILELGDDWFTMTALPGVTGLAAVAPERRHRAIDALAELTGTIHGLPAVACPFDRRLDVVVAEARDRAARGAVDLADLDPVRAGRDTARLISELLRALPRARNGERERLVVTHGDLTPHNVLLDPTSGALVGVIDPPRLGLADACVDFALMDRSLRNHATSADARRYLTRCGWDPEDDEPLAFYRLLDEFF